MKEVKIHPDSNVKLLTGTFYQLDIPNDIEFISLKDLSFDIPQEFSDSIEIHIKTCVKNNNTFSIEWPDNWFVYTFDNDKMNPSVHKYNDLIEIYSLQVYKENSKIYLNKECEIPNSVFSL